MWLRASRAEPSTTSRTTKPIRLGPRALEAAREVTIAPPRLWPTRIVGGRVGQDMCSLVRVIMVRASEARVSMLKSVISSSDSGLVVTEPWARASRLRIPAPGSFCRMCWAQTAKERPDAPAPWWHTNRGPFLGSVGGVR